MLPHLGLSGNKLPLFYLFCGFLLDLLMHGMLKFSSVVFGVFIANKENEDRTIFGNWLGAGVSQEMSYLKRDFFTSQLLE